MGIGISTFVLAVGAVLVWAVTAEVDAVDLNLVGIILVIVGVVGLVTSLVTMGGRRERDMAPRPPVE